MKLFTLLKNNNIKLLLLIIAFVAGGLLFQAQIPSSPPAQNDPNIDQVPYDLKLYYAIHPPEPRPLLVQTGDDGFDNFDIGVDFAESMISVNPNLPVASLSLYNMSTGHYTINGLDWTNTYPPFPSSAGDPWTAYDSLGNLFVINLNGSVNGTWVIKSTNNGASWGSAVSGCTGNDRETMSADQTGGPYKNYIYCCETPGNFYRSTDGGQSFQFTQSMSNTLPGMMSTVGPNGSIQGGSVYVVTSTGNAFIPTYNFYRSTDGGASFSLMSTQNNWVNTVGTQVGGRNSVENMRLRPYPFVSADNTYGPYRGRYYMVYCANNPPGNGNKPDVYCRYSTDGGTTWSNPTTVNDDPNSTNNHQFHPAQWCDKTTGRLYIQWMDTRNCPTSDSAEIYASYSTNGGVSFVTNQKISTAKMKINCYSCPGGGTPRYQGDYNGTGSNATTSFLSWTDFRNNNFGSFNAFFPDFAMKVRPAAFNLQGQNDSGFIFVSVPAIKLYTDKVKFTASLTPTPPSGTITMTFLNKSNNNLLDSLTSYPDSLRLRVKTSGGVTNQTYTITILGKGTNGTPVHSRTVTLGVMTGINISGNLVPDKFNLYQNYPNPFNPATQIRFDIAKAGAVKLSVYDITGKLVSTLINANYSAGKYNKEFDAANFSSGIYFYKLETPDFTSIKKMILVK